MNLNNKNYKVDFDDFEKKLKRFLKTSEEKQREAARHVYNDNHGKRAKSRKPRKEDT